VLRAACAEALRWPQPYRAAVNISAYWFQGEDLSLAVEAALLESGLDPGRLEIEVTERVFIDNSGNARRELAQLKALGVGLSLDDFGTGYSSLSYLRTIPFDKLKLDRLFIENLGTCRRTEVITRAVLQLGAGLDMTVCAEGVAHQTQLEILQAYGCDEVQGYLIGRPGPLTPERFTLYTRLDRSSLFMGPELLEADPKSLA
jgi:EAL domain-containing protein (putative c-di-GMP-specific phosphodiesterase class I)